MKIVVIRKKIIINSSILVLLLLSLAGAIAYNIYQRKNSTSAVENIKSEISQIKSRTAELRTKTLEIAKYTALWKEIPDNRKNLEGIKMAEVNTALTETAEKYNISAPTIKVSIPEVVNSGIFNRKTITTSFATVSVSFLALDDTRAIMFISEFINKMPGYKVATSMTLAKKKEYSQSDFVDISLGRSSGVIDGEVSFVWYTHKEKKEGDKAPPSTGKDSPVTPAKNQKQNN